MNCVSDLEVTYVIIYIPAPMTGTAEQPSLGSSRPAGRCQGNSTPGPGRLWTSAPELHVFPTHFPPTGLLFFCLQSILDLLYQHIYRACDTSGALRIDFVPHGRLGACARTDRPIIYETLILKNESDRDCFELSWRTLTSKTTPRSSASRAKLPSSPAAHEVWV